MRREFVSFPKSGRSWLRYALTLAGVADSIVFHHDGCEYSERSMPPHDLDFGARLARHSHGGKIVYMGRDPRDVMVSLFHQVRGRMSNVFDFRGDLSEFLRHPYFGAHNLRDFSRQWEQICERGLALRVTYEECSRDFPKVLRRVLAYYDLPVADDVFEGAARGATFEQMKRREDSGTFPDPWLRLRNGAPKMRRGIVGSHRIELCHDDIRLLDQLFASP